MLKGIPQLFDDQQGSQAGDESTQSIVSGPGPFPVQGRKSTHRNTVQNGYKIGEAQRAPAGRTGPTTRCRCSWCASKRGKSVLAEARSTVRHEVATPDSWYWSASGGSLGCVDADASSLSHPAATVDLQQARGGDPRQRAVPRRGGTATTLEETRHLLRSQ